MTTINAGAAQSASGGNDWFRRFIGAVRSFELRYQPAKHRLMFTAIAWLLVFGTGMTIPSKPVRDVIVQSFFAWGYEAPSAQSNALETLGPPAVVPSGSIVIAKPTTTPRSLPMETLVPRLWYLLPLVLLSFTPTNILVLCILGSLLGAYSMQLHLATNTLEKRAAVLLTQSPSGTPAQSGCSHCPLIIAPRVSAPSAILNGLCVFLGVASGVIVVQGEIQWDIESPGLYLRLVAVATLFAVVAGANPDFLRQLASAFRPLPSSPPPRP
jgi:hypothetical protein